MLSFAVPDGGLTLPGLLPIDTDHKKQEGPCQALQLDLDDTMLQDLIKAIRHGGKTAQLSMGKTVSLHYGTKTRTFAVTPAPRLTCLYSQSPEEIHQATLLGQISHHLTMQKAQDQMAGTDNALATLQSSLASAQQAKQSKQTQFIADNSSLPPAVKQTAASLKGASTKAGPMSMLKKQHAAAGLQRPLSSTRGSNSLANPSLLPSIERSKKPDRTDGIEPLSSAHKVAAIRFPLIHLLAIRPLSTSYLARELHCKEQDVSDLLNRVAKPSRLDAAKFELNDKVYKDLDICSFPYPDQDVRDLAQERAISAFDRQRLPAKDPTWQRLLPKHERGKGKTLSKLNHLQNGPIKQATTPRIHVHQPDIGLPMEDKVDGHTKGATEKTGTGKSATLKGMKKTKSAAIKDQAASSLAKKANKKTTQPLSSEFVLDSDEDETDSEALDDPMNACNSPRNTSPRSATPVEKASVEQGQKSRSAALQDRTNAEQPRSSNENSNQVAPIHHKHKSDLAKRNPPKTLTKAGAIGKSEFSSASSDKPFKKLSGVKVARAVTGESARESRESDEAGYVRSSRPRHGSSPVKPSPLGSSPPANASDVEHSAASSASSTPLISYMDRSKQYLHAKPAQNSEHTLKRKAGDIDNNIHRHDARSQTIVNGYMVHHMENKRQRTSELTPPSSDSPSPPSIDTKKYMLERAQIFKDLYVRYANLHRELETLADPSSESIRKLERMRTRLADLKTEIYKGEAALRAGEDEKKQSWKGQSW